MAKRKRPTAKQRAAWARLQRGPSGRFLSREELAARAREQLQRVADAMFATPAERAKLKQSALRQAEVKAEKQLRRKRFKARPQGYKWKANPNSRTLADADIIADGGFPPYADKFQQGQYTAYVWAFQGEHALKTAQDFLLERRKDFPSDAHGYLAFGNGHGPNSVWAGTKYGTPRDIWWHSQTILTSKSETIADLVDQMNENEGRNIWVEVKITTKERIEHVKPRQAEPSRSKPSQARKSKGTRSR